MIAHDFESKSCSLLAIRTWSSSPNLLAADTIARDCGSARAGLAGLTSRPVMRAVGTSSWSNSSSFGATSTVQLGHACHIATRSVQATDEAKPDRVGGRFEDNRNDKRWQL